MLTRGQFVTDLPVFYKIKFAKSNFPPKLIQIAVNKRIICYGPTGESQNLQSLYHKFFFSTRFFLIVNVLLDHSVLLTQIVLEHTRKLTFLPEGAGKLLANTESATSLKPPTQILSDGVGVTNFYHHVDKFPPADWKDSLPSVQNEVHNKHQINNPLEM